MSFDNEFRKDILRMPGVVYQRMRRIDGTVDFDGYSKRQRPNIHLLIKSQQKGKRDRLKRSNTRNLLGRLRHIKQDVLRFMEVESIPFTNNQDEDDLRITKVPQNISGYFRSMEGVEIICRVRSYLSTCRKQCMTTTQALTLLVLCKSPDFMKKNKTQ